MDMTNFYSLQLFHWGSKYGLLIFVGKPIDIDVKNGQCQAKTIHELVVIDVLPIIHVTKSSTGIVNDTFIYV